MNKYLKYFIIFVLGSVVVGVIWLSSSILATTKKHYSLTSLEKIQKNRIIHVVLLNEKKGIEYALVKKYADYLDVDLDVTYVSTQKEALAWNPNVDIIAAGIEKTRQREKKFDFGPSYFKVQEQMVCSTKMSQGKRIPKDIGALGGLNIMLEEDSIYSETLKSFIDDGYDIDVEYTDKFSVKKLLSFVDDNIIDCTMVNSDIYTKNRSHLTNTTLAFSLSEKKELAWIFPHKEKALKQNLYSWFQDYSQSRQYKLLQEHYYRQTLKKREIVSDYKSKIFCKRIKTRLCLYEHYFKKYGDIYNLPWTLLASIAYQESLWNPLATSFTGVRGMMMLTNRTAKMLGVENRLNARESIFGGTKHIKYMIKTVPKGIEEEDRLRFALAAYNVGMGHIYDAQKLAKELSYNPNKWDDVKRVLPLLSKKEYYKNLKYGYARGYEPVQYVEAIYKYRDVLENYLKK